MDAILHFFLERGGFQVIGFIVLIMLFYKAYTLLNTKIDKVQNELNTKIDKVQSELNTKIDNVQNELNNEIKQVNNKIDTLNNILLSHFIGKRSKDNPPSSS